ncbi:ubiquitin-conjugating enzyme E2 [Emydomyces testavorans]|uniref:Ubiquitin-conjugating enzyme E2 n=1 Tax=Emydomyces testavorans TaxID=2070801 RepID=A0AAF0DMA6_9EURO|nr:ubiquitin-conjugating enzyme E2 [Emydomyces testavorans]
MAVPGPTLRRLMKEAQELSASSPSPSPYFHAHPISDSNLFDWHFTLAGPPAPSPYAHGIYHGRIILSPQYPLRPPSFRFLTPSGRFEVNREICLSISGHHDETWQPAWGIRTALIALRSFMDGEVRGQVGGMEAREELRREWARRSREWRCEVCPGRRTNEEVLREWWEVCRGKGVAVEEGEDRAVRMEEVPEGLRVRYRDELGREEGDGKGEKLASESQAEQRCEKEERNTNGSIAGRAAAISTATRAPRPTPTTSTSDRSMNLRQRSTRTQTQTASTAPANASTSTQTAHDPWLDRAIVGVLVALVLMVLKKILYSSSDER